MGGRDKLSHPKNKIEGEVFFMENPLSKKGSGQTKVVATPYYNVQRSPWSIDMPDTTQCNVVHSSGIPIKT